MEKFSEIVYRRPDLSAYQEEQRAHIRRIEAAGSWEELRAEWLAQDKKARRLYTAYNIAFIRNTIDTQDPFYEEEVRYFNSQLPAITLLEHRAEAALLSSPFLPRFEAEFGEILVKTMRSGQRLADERLIPLQIRESDLAQEYSKVSATAKAALRGEECSLYGLLKAMQSTDRELRREAFLAWAGLYEEIAPRLDEIYSEMVRLRTRMAETLGFGSYTEMAYLDRRRFDYTAGDTARFRQKIKEVVTPACARLFEKQRLRLGLDRLHWYDETLVFPEGNADPEGTKDELLAKALEMYRELSPETGEYFQFMVDRELFDLESKPGKRLGGYCTSLPEDLSPFIFANFNGTAADINVLTHEAGHGFEDYTASRRLPLMDQSHSTSEINEIHSMAMEHFTYPWMEKFFGDKTPKYLYDHLWGALNVLPYMCCVDEFQHRVYDAPGMTPEQRRQVWHQLEREYLPWRDYDGNAFLAEGGFWMQKQHIFLYPFYYIEYALAQVCAFQFYLRMTEDRSAAWSDYLRLCQAGGSLGYFDLLKLAGLKNPFDDGTVEAVAAAVEREIDRLEERLG